MSRTYLTISTSMAAHAGIRLWLTDHEPRAVIECARSGAEALAIARRVVPDIVIVADPLHDMPAAGFAALLFEQQPQGEVIVLGDLPGHLIRHGIEAGIGGFVSTRGGQDALLAAIDAIAGGRTYVDPTLAGSLYADESENPSPRELQILDLLVDGHQNKVIAEKLEISQETVKSHVSTLLRKLDAASRTELVVRAVQRSFVQIPTAAWRGGSA